MDQCRMISMFGKNLLDLFSPRKSVFPLNSISEPLSRDTHSRESYSSSSCLQNDAANIYECNCLHGIRLVLSMG